MLKKAKPKIISPVIVIQNKKKNEENDTMVATIITASFWPWLLLQSVDFDDQTNRVQVSLLLIVLLWACKSATLAWTPIVVLFVPTVVNTISFPTPAVATAKTVTWLFRNQTPTGITIPVCDMKHYWQEERDTQNSRWAHKLTWCHLWRKHDKSSP